MRYRLFTVLLCLSVPAALPAAAQNNTQTNWQQQQPVYAVPMYVAPNGTPMYSANGTSGVPVYNNNGQPVAVDQLVAGKNAPSYNFNNNAYTGFNSNPMGNVSSIGSLTPQQAQLARSQRDAEIAAYERTLLQQMGQGSAGTGAAPTAYQGGVANELYTANQGGQQRPPTRKRVVYNERNNPLYTPPRLFSID